MPDPELVEFYNCRVCQREINRRYIEPLRKHVFEVCRCENLQREQDELVAERLRRKREMDRAYRHNIMNQNLVHARFSNFTPRDGTYLMFKETMSFAQNFDNYTTGLLCYGDPGNGKSHLCAAIHHYLDEKGYVSLFLDCSQLFNIAEDAKKYSSKISISEIINAAIGCDLLTLDELGAGKITQDEFTDILFPIINGRQGKKTNFTTNLDLDELQQWLAVDKYGKPLDSKNRIIDRIIGSCETIVNEGSSYRLEQNAKRFNEAAGKDKKRQWA